MPKTMTFQREELELIRKLLRTELKRAQTAVERTLEPRKTMGDPGRPTFATELAERHRDRVAGLLQEAQLPVMVTRRNLMSGQEYQEAEDTPLSCSPASETYWSM